MMGDRRSRYGLAGSAVGRTTLPCHTEIMWRAGGLQFNVPGERLIVEPVQHALVLVRRDHLLLSNVYSATHRNQQESVQRVCTQATREIEHSRQLMRIVSRDGCVDLHRHADVLQITQAINGSVECSGYAAEGVMGGGVRAIQRDRNTLDARVLDFF